jgi:hypothetical protein
MKFNIFSIFVGHFALLDPDSHQWLEDFIYLQRTEHFLFSIWQGFVDIRAQHHINFGYMKEKTKIVFFYFF